MNESESPTITYHSWFHHCHFNSLHCGPCSCNSMLLFFFFMLLHFCFCFYFNGVEVQYQTQSLEEKCPCFLEKRICADLFSNIRQPLYGKISPVHSQILRGILYTLLLIMPLFLKSTPPMLTVDCILDCCFFYLVKIVKDYGVFGSTQGPHVNTSPVRNQNRKCYQILSKGFEPVISCDYILV